MLVATVLLLLVFLAVFSVYDLFSPRQDYPGVKFSGPEPDVQFPSGVPR